MARRQRVDSIAAAKVIAASAGREIAPPAHIRMANGDWPFWQSVVAEFPKADWTAHQLEVAAQLAKAMSRLERESNLLDDEGTITADGRISPRHAIVRDNTNSVMSLRRNLSLHARARSVLLFGEQNRKHVNLVADAPHMKAIISREPIPLDEFANAQTAKLR